MSEPAGVDFSSISIVWTGATVDPVDATRAYRAGDVANAASVIVTATDDDNESLSNTSKIVVVKVDQIVPQNASVLVTVDDDHAITGVNASAVTVLADISPSTPDLSPIYDTLLVWIGDGEHGATADAWQVNRAAPSRMPVRVRCGASGDDLTVWTAQVNLIMGNQTEANEALDASVVSVVCNTGDDNGNTIEDRLESHGVQALGVVGEKDLGPVRLGVEPHGLPKSAESWL